MRISNVDNTAFRGKIIDVHAHTGRFFNNDFKPSMIDDIVRDTLDISVGGKKEKDTVEKILVSNLDCMNNDTLKDEMRGNVDMLKITRRNPKMYPLAVCEPSKPGAGAKVIENLLNKHKGEFVGLKFHPEALELAADSTLYDEYLKLAADKKLPCLFHCEAGVSSPDKIYALARRHPDVPVIMAHLGAGGAENHRAAINTLINSIDKNDAKLYADISWVDWAQGLPSEEPGHVIDLIKKLKERDALDRIMFGTDTPLGCYGERLEGGLSAKQAYELTVSRLKSAIKSNFGDEADDIINKIFYDNANKLFFEGKNTVKKVPLGKTLAKAGIIAAAALTACAVLFKAINTDDGLRGKR